MKVVQTKISQVVMCYNPKRVMNVPVDTHRERIWPPQD
jgi:endonuclease III